MAKTVVALVIGLMLLAGCQPQTSMIDPLPSPTFAGPAVAGQHPAAPIEPKLGGGEPAKPLPPVAQIPGVPREWTPPVHPRPWQWIVVHHSASAAGGAAAFDREHRQKGWDELGYDFVIGNGTDTRDGQIEVGSRWIKQKQGAHTKTPDNRYNDYGIGICLVGNFDLDRPTAAQMQSLAKLTAYLMKTYHVPSDHILGHRDCKSTDCPGRHMSVAEVRRRANQYLSDCGYPVDLPVQTANTDPPDTETGR